MNDEPIKHPVVKAATAFGTWAATALVPHSWTEAAGMFATIYSICLITEWGWKRVLKPAGQRWGLLKGAPRGFLDSTP